ncbi:hypothetical protein PWT90_11198 [Aphanocladium album]|nr:hypothetical protein PWT90_11198 [Aphanocladium album]
MTPLRKAPSVSRRRADIIITVLVILRFLGIITISQLLSPVPPLLTRNDLQCWLQTHTAPHGMQWTGRTQTLLLLPNLTRHVHHHVQSHKLLSYICQRLRQLRQLGPQGSIGSRFPVRIRRRHKNRLPTRADYYHWKSRLASAPDDASLSHPAPRTDTAPPTAVVRREALPAPHGESPRSAPPPHYPYPGQSTPRCTPQDQPHGFFLSVHQHHFVSNIRPAGKPVTTGTTTHVNPTPSLHHHHILPNALLGATGTCQHMPWLPPVYLHPTK